MSPIVTHLQHIYEDMVQMLRHQRYAPYHANSLFQGPWGALLFMFYYEQYIDPQSDQATELLEALYSSYTPDADGDYSLCSGHSGPFWLLAHGCRHQFLDLGLDDLVADVIPAAIRESNQLIARRDLDFLHGSAGICLFLLNFAHRSDVALHLQHFVLSIQQLSKITPHGRSLPIFHVQEIQPAAYVDAFSLAHGSCALLILLTKIYQAGIAQGICAQLITECIPFILHHRNETTATSTHALFPAILQSHYPTSRLAWCYGDLNVALALWRCGQTLSVRNWKTEALSILHYNTRRNTPETAGIADSCFCHGAAGIAAFYTRFWQETKDPAFQACATHWHQHAVAGIAFSPDNHVHGINVWRNADGQWTYAWDLLDGSSGVGLSLLSHVHGQPLPWDECFLLS